MDPFIFLLLPRMRNLHLTPDFVSNLHGILSQHFWGLYMAFADQGKSGFPKTIPIRGSIE